MNYIDKYTEVMNCDVLHNMPVNQFAHASQSACSHFEWTGTGAINAMRYSRAFNPSSETRVSGETSPRRVGNINK